MAANKIDLNYRPKTYRLPPNFEALALQAIKGTKRRNLVKKLIKEGNFEMLSSFLQKESLTSKERKVWGSIHPMFMGGEYVSCHSKRE